LPAFSLNGDGVNPASHADDRLNGALRSTPHAYGRPFRRWTGEKLTDNDKLNGLDFFNDEGAGLSSF
jgi:hypothetical protein